MNRALTSFLVGLALCSLTPSALAVTYQWKAIDGPAARQGSRIAFDETRGRAVLFGGFSPSGTLNDTWEWDGGAWLARSPFSPPAPRATHMTLFDARLGRVGMFGGIGSVFYQDAFTWDGSSWKEEKIAGTRPEARSFQAMTYDSARQTWLMFGGISAGGTYLNDTWEYSSATHTWTQRTPVVSPEARSEASMTFDSTRNVALIVGGVALRDGATDSDTWEWDGAKGTWTKLSTNVVPNIYDPALAYDPIRDRMVMFGGFDGAPTQRTFELRRTGAGTAVWDEKFPTSPPIASRLPSATFDTVRKRVLVYSSAQDGDSGLWEWDGSDWLQRGPGGSVPFGRGFPQTVYDSARKEFVLFAGTTGGPLNDTWVWDGSSWHERKPVTSPSARYGGSFAFDSFRKKSVMFGGSRFTGGPPETWEWDGTNWVERSSTTRPDDVRDNSVMTFDSARSVSVMVGKLFNGVENETQTWEWNGIDWARRTTAVAPSPRNLPCAAFDQVRNETIFFGGMNDSQTVFFDDTWSYVDGVWTERTPATSPSKRGLCKMVFDPSRGHVVLFAGIGPKIQNDMWEWDGTNWQKVDLIPTPIVSAEAMTLGYDGAHLVLQGTTLSGGGIAILVPKTDVCTTTADCSGGTYCVDGVCCQSTVCGSCETCNGLTPGSCSPVLNDTDPDTCSGVSSCNAKGECLSAVGAKCDDGSSCATGSCVDGVCCDSACTGTCVACSAALKESGDRDGLCGPAKAGSDVRNQCEGSDATSCGLDGACDGSGACRKHVKGTICDTAATCTSVATASARVCDGLGVCSSGTEPVECKGYLCVDKIGCPTSCAADTECNDGFKCRDGACTLTRVGCATIEDCASGFVCDFNGQCVIAPAIVNPEGCSMGVADERSSLWFAPVGVFAAMAIRKVRRRRA